MTHRNLMVLVDDRQGESLDSVVAEITRRGFHVERVIRGMKTIVGGTDDDSVIAKVRGVEGVASVREEGKVSLPPMNPAIPQ